MSTASALGDWAACGLVWARLAPSGVALGLLSGGVVPIWLALAVCLALAPALALGIEIGPLLAAGAPALLASLVRELCLGAAFAVAAGVPWLTLSYALRSLSLAGVSGVEAISKLYLLAALALCVALGAPRAYVQALSASLHEVPVGLLTAGREPWLSETLNGVTAALHATLSLALPLWMAVWLVDATLALVARALGHAEPTRSPLRAAVGLLLLALWLGPLTAHAPLWLRTALHEARAVVMRLAR